jgi:hypothetical protein
MHRKRRSRISEQAEVLARGGRKPTKDEESSHLQAASLIAKMEDQSRLRDNRAEGRLRERKREEAGRCQDSSWPAMANKTTAWISGKASPKTEAKFQVTV